MDGRGGHRVVVAEVPPPGPDRELRLLSRGAVRADVDQGGGGQGGVVGVQLDDGPLRLRGVLAHLREADDGGAGPAGDPVRIDVPLGDWSCPGVVDT